MKVALTFFLIVVGVVSAVAGDLSRRRLNVHLPGVTPYSYEIGENVSISGALVTRWREYIFFLWRNCVTWVDRGWSDHFNNIFSWSFLFCFSLG